MKVKTCVKLKLIFFFFSTNILRFFLSSKAKCYSNTRKRGGIFWICEEQRRWEKKHFPSPYKIECRPISVYNLQLCIGICFVSIVFFFSFVAMEGHGNPPTIIWPRPSNPAPSPKSPTTLPMGATPRLPQSCLATAGHPPSSPPATTAWEEGEGCYHRGVTPLTGAGRSTGIRLHRPWRTWRMLCTRVSRGDWRWWRSWGKLTIRYRFVKRNLLSLIYAVWHCTDSLYKLHNNEIGRWVLV